MRTAMEVIKPYVEQHPENKFAVTDSMLGVWIESEQRFAPFAAATLTGQWVYMPTEILVNGKRIDRNWIAVN
jgi:hypothetical protein